MILPRSDDAQGPIAGSVPGDRRDRERRKVARKWAYLISLTAYLPMPHAEIERELLDLINRLLEAATCEPMPTERVMAVGARLVELHCVGRMSLQCTVDVLVGALLAEPALRRSDRPAERVARLLGTLASGYAEAIRSSTLEQQDNLNRALLGAMGETERNLRISEARLAEVLACVPTGIAITDLNGRFERVNAAFDRAVARTVDGSAQATLFDLVSSQDRRRLRDAYTELLDGKLQRLALRQELVRPDGETAQVSLAASLLRDADGEPSHYMTVVGDDTELSLLRSQLNHQLLHDVLTGLPNRQYFTTRLEHIVHTARPTTLYELELDGFPLLTDGLGRQVADSLLRTVAERLVALFADREGMVAHFESGTFCILVEGSPTAPDIATVVGQINEVLGEPVHIGDVRVTVAASIGVVGRLARDADPTELLRAADLALRQARGMGGGQWALSDPERDARDRETFGLAATMPGAWDSGQLRVGYQPVVRLADEHVLGVDALLRWDHPRLGTLAHRRCVQLAERTGLIRHLRGWLLHGACSRVGPRPDLPLWVDLTRSQSSDPGLVGEVLRVLDEAGLATGRLQLGIPAPRLRNDEVAAGNVRRLADAGVRITLHHFGGTPADVACLEDLPVSAVRITAPHGAGSGSLVARAVTDLVALVHLAGATVTVDDIQTRAQADWWRAAGADAATGPWFGPA